MSQTFILDSFRFFIGLLASTTILAVSLDVQETDAQVLISAPANSAGILPKGQPFLSLLDDVTVKNQPNSFGYFSKVAQCQLNAPVVPETEVIDEAPPESLDWATLLMYSCTDKDCADCSSFTFTNSPLGDNYAVCDWTCGSTTDLSQGCPSCDSQTIQGASKAYCEQIAEFLMTTLQSSQASVEAKRKAVKSAMSMVQEKTLVDAELQISKLKAAHQKEINQLQEQLLSARDQSESIALLMSRLRPIYSNQIHSYRQLERPPVYQDGLPEYDFSKLERSGFEDTNPITNRRLLPSSAQMASKLMEEQRQAEIARLKRELEIIDARLSRLVVKPLQRAAQLEPVYVPNQQLVPIRDLPPRHTRLENLDRSSKRYR